MSIAAETKVSCVTMERYEVRLCASDAGRGRADGVVGFAANTLVLPVVAAVLLSVSILGAASIAPQYPRAYAGHPSGLACFHEPGNEKGCTYPAEGGGGASATAAGGGARAAAAGQSLTIKGHEPPAAAGGGDTRKVLVICAPGYPGDTQQAQPTMDQFAAVVERTAGLKAGSLGAVYFETEQGGLQRLADSDAALALVPFPFFVEHGAKLALKPRLRVEDDAGASEVWSLVARRGRIRSAAALAGWELTGTAGYAPAFVRTSALGSWGALPASVQITFSPGVLPALRRASKGENVAVLLDPVQAAALGSLPFAGELEVVTRSQPLPGSLLCSVGERMSESEAGSVIAALLALHEKAEAREILKTMRMKRFEAKGTKGLEGLAREAARPPAAGR